MPELKHSFAVIGAGEIGSRHLQGICKTVLPASVHVIDPSQASLLQAEKRAREILAAESELKLAFSTDLSSLPSSLDVAILATNSLVRLEVLQKLLAISKVRFLILEKIAFPSRPSFIAAGKTISEHSSLAWVNCPRRMNPAYRLIRERLSARGPVSMSVAGCNYGLACNSIHFIDLFSFLTGRTAYSINANGLVPQIFPSKRTGCIEIYGKLELDFGEGFGLNLSCDDCPEKKIDFTIHMAGDGFDIAIDEIKGLVSVSGDTSGLFDGISYRTIFQSSLSNLVVEKLITSGDCDLTPFDESMSIHLPFIDMISDFYARLSGKSHETVPIT